MHLLSAYADLLYVVSFGVWGKTWNSGVSFPDHCLIYVSCYNLHETCSLPKKLKNSQCVFLLGFLFGERRGTDNLTGSHIHFIATRHI